MEHTTTVTETTSEIINETATPVSEQKTPTTPEPASTAKISGKSKRKNRFFFYLVLIVLFVFITNPQAIPFLPSVMTAPLSNITERLFGDMSSILEIVSFNVMGIVQVVVMALVLLLLREGLLFLFARLKPQSGRGKTILNLAVSGSQYIIFFVGVFWGLSLLGVNISTLFASVGILALIIGFGAESLIADVITGCFLIFENQYNVGDIIEVDGYRGTVTQIGVRTTSIEDISGNEKIFNNSDVRNIINLSSDDSYAVCDIAIPYTADLDKAKVVVERILQTLAEQEPTRLKKCPEFLGVQAFTGEGVVLRVRAMVAEKDRYNVARTLNWALKVGLEKEGMGVPYSSEVQSVQV